MVEALQKGYQGKVLAVYPGPDKSYAMLTAKADMDDDDFKTQSHLYGRGHR